MQSYDEYFAEQGIPPLEYETRLFSVATSTKYEPAKRVRAESRNEAAEIVANRIARRWYGRKGYCHHVRHDCRAMDYSRDIYEAFIGHDVRGAGCEGRNIWLYVS